MAALKLKSWPFPENQEAELNWFGSPFMLFNEVTEAMYTKIQKNLIENKKLNDIRDTLLPKLLSGEIRVPVKREYTENGDLPMVAECSEQYNTIT